MDSEEPDLGPTTIDLEMEEAPGGFTNLILRLPEIICPNSEMPVYGGIVAADYAANLPFGSVAVPIHENVPGFVSAANLPNWHHYMFRLDVWCGLRLLQSVRHSFTLDSGREFQRYKNFYGHHLLRFPC